MARKKKENNSSTLAKNKKAYFNYEIIEKFEAGLVLKGTEVKSVKMGKVSIKEAFGRIINGEAFVVGMSITELENAGVFNHNTRRDRKLLLHKKELKRIRVKLETKGMTLVPLAIYRKKHLVKCQVALAKGKREFEKRQTIKERDTKREIDRAIKNFNKFQ